MTKCNEKFISYKESLKQEKEEVKNETLSEENEPKWYDKAIEDYTDSDVADYMNSRTNYGKDFNCLRKGSLSWDCSNDEFNCLVFKMKAYSSLKHSCSRK